MMRIAVFGICQAYSYAHALAHLLPDAEVQAFQASLVRGEGRIAEVADLLTGFDAVLTQRFSADEMEALATPALLARCPRIVMVPTVVFTGYQPDVVLLPHEGKLLASPVGSYHSAIAAAGFSLGLPEYDVQNLFNRLVYARLGYFEEFVRARDFLLASITECGLPLEAGTFDAWHRRGPFMLTMNHPCIFVFATLARAAAIQLGLLDAAVPTPELRFDPLAIDTIWPVYPELAEALGVPGDLLFKRQTALTQPIGNMACLPLPAFLRESFAMYRDYPVQAFEAEDVIRVRRVLAG
ncbi:WcbI family polysaccharide biosynthesis putative acetyltransferase [Nannocystis sp. ILAH1]|uniref:WcbI family polysaccharide biosynthesis putative acetyltransferase n=1 Tax=unclassified Nannocystis TaxID=2627009 RepID=UPI0022711730|nr:MULTISPECIES: WcbI family polysaccharide biosynthesis putative acetyltransferase [unclassified Nannocystis]MCY0992212.1 WcbI family polysaccharide biosynthesis putative acetyltransferase [Nannocystis sp. ILAH1]MCY1069198.1 WcbI family polysaccharide biosynthesis putative acetyltransferase [Nannocystis sp. RBIL2]